MTKASPIFTDPPSPLAPLLRRTIGDEVLDTLRKAIIAGAFAPGDHLAEGHLAEQLGVSRAPVREAMMQLEQQGLLVFDRRGAARVKDFTDDDFEEIISLRLTLESMAARLCCRRWSAVEAARFEESIERTRAAIRLLDVTLSDVEFHDGMVRMAQHSRLYACWSNLRPQIEVWLARMHSRLESSAQETREITVRHHRRLVEALRSGREERAVKAIRQHIEGWRRQHAGSAKPAARRRTG
jgi:DNA-binding GntR family transcriptional regulator